MEQVEEQVYILTQEDLQQEYENLKYFDADLNPTNDVLWEEMKGDKEKEMDWLMEVLFINKMNTIGANLNWIVQHHYSPFKQKTFKKIITDPTTQANEFGEILNLGQKMSLDEFNAFEKFYNTLFETKIIK